MKKNLLISAVIGGLTGLLWFMAWLLLGVIFDQNRFSKTLSPIFTFFSRNVADTIADYLVKSKLINMHDAITAMIVICFISIIIGVVIGVFLFCGNYILRILIKEGGK